MSQIVRYVILKDINAVFTRNLKVTFPIGLYIYIYILDKNMIRSKNINLINQSIIYVNKYLGVI